MCGEGATLLSLQFSPDPLAALGSSHRSKERWLSSEARTIPLHPPPPTRESIPRDGTIADILTSGEGGGNQAGASHTGNRALNLAMKSSGSPGFLTPLTCWASLASQCLFRQNEGGEGQCLGL